MTHYLFWVFVSFLKCHHFIYFNILVHKTITIIHIYIQYTQCIYYMYFICIENIIWYYSTKSFRTEDIWPFVIWYM